MTKTWSLFLCACLAGCQGLGVAPEKPTVARGQSADVVVPPRPVAAVPLAQAEVARQVAGQIAELKKKVQGLSERVKARNEPKPTPPPESQVSKKMERRLGELERRLVTLEEAERTPPPTAAAPTQQEVDRQIDECLRELNREVLELTRSLSKNSLELPKK